MRLCLDPRAERISRKSRITPSRIAHSPASDGVIEGMLCVVMEDTARVLGERQLSSLTTLASALVDCQHKAGDL